MKSLLIVKCGGHRGKGSEAASGRLEKRRRQGDKREEKYSKKSLESVVVESWFSYERASGGEVYGYGEAKNESARVGREVVIW